MRNRNDRGGIPQPQNNAVGGPAAGHRRRRPSRPSSIQQTPSNLSAPSSLSALRKPLTVDELAALLSAAGQGQITVETIRRHLQQGAPQRRDGRLDLIRYTAWLVSEVTVGED